MVWLNTLSMLKARFDHSFSAVFLPWVPEPKNNKKKKIRKERKSFLPSLLPISFHLNFEALVPRVPFFQLCSLIYRLWYPNFPAFSVKGYQTISLKLTQLPRVAFILLTSKKRPKMASQLLDMPFHPTFAQLMTPKHKCIKIAARLFFLFRSNLHKFNETAFERVEENNPQQVLSF